MKKLSCILFINHSKTEKRIEMLIHKMNSIEIAGIYRDHFGLIERLSTFTPDIIFVSIEKEMILTDLNKSPFLIGISSEKDEESALTKMYFDILTRPIQDNQFCSVIGRIIKIVNTYNIPISDTTMVANSLFPYKEMPIKPKEEFIFIKQKKSSVKLLFDNILFISNEKNYINIETVSGKTISYRSTLKQFNTKLSNEQFVRINRSIIVNFSKIDSVEKRTVKLQEYTFVITRKYLEGLKNLMNKL